MPSTYTTNLGIELPADGELDGIWGDVVNENMDIIDRAINGSVTLSLSGTTSTLTTTDGALSNGQFKLLVLGGTPSGTHTITVAPNDAQKIYFVTNGTAQSVVFTQGSGGNVTIAAGDSGIIYTNGGGASAAVANITNDFAMSSVKITGGSITGITDLAVADGGTGASDAGTARTNLGLAIGTNVQAYDADLQAIAGLAVTDSNFIVGNGTTWVVESGSTARTSLGLGTIATQNSASVSITGGSITGITDLAVADGGTGASDAGTARTNLGLAIGTNVQAYDAGLQSIAGLTTTADRMIYTTASDVYAVATLTSAGRALLDDADAAAQRTTLGLGTIATQAANSVSITGGSITGITDLAVADGGTGASDAGTARTNLGLAIGTNVQAWDVNLDQIAALAPTADNFIVGNGTAWILETPAQALASLGVTSTAAELNILDGVTATAAELNLVDGSVSGTIVNSKAVIYGAAGQVNATTLQIAGTSITSTAAELNILDGVTATTAELNFVDGVTSAIQTQLNNKQPLDADLTAIAALAVTDGNFIVGNGTTWVVESGSTARTSLGLGTISTQAANSVSITGGSITGITDLAVADGGTGVSTLTGLVKGNGTSAFSAAVAGTDFQAPITGAATSITTSNLTASRALASDGSGKVAASSVTSTELEYLSGITGITSRTSATGSSVVATGTTLQRDGSPSAGFFRFNSTLGEFEGYDGTEWGSLGGSTVSYQEFTSSGTWTKPAGVSMVYFEVVGGGGSGGVARSTGANAASGGNGGQGAFRTVRAADLGATVTVTIGAGGAAVTRSTDGTTAGNAGGTTSFGTVISATGGAGGTVAIAPVPGVDAPQPAPFYDLAFNGQGGSALEDGCTAGTISIFGGGGGGAGSAGAGQNTPLSSSGGTSQWAGAGGAGGTGAGTATSGAAGGGGGGGRASTTGTVTSGAGGVGRVRVWAW